VGAYDRGREPVTFIEGGGSRRCVGLRADVNALHPIRVPETRQVAEQSVLKDWHEIFFQEYAGRLAACVLDDLDIMWRRRVPRHAGTAKRQRVGHGRKWPPAPPPPPPTALDPLLESAASPTHTTQHGCRRRGRERRQRDRTGSESGPRSTARAG